LGAPPLSRAAILKPQALSRAAISCAALSRAAIFPFSRSDLVRSTLSRSDWSSEKDERIAWWDGVAEGDRAFFSVKTD
jgi:hypothetical protein